MDICRHATLLLFRWGQAAAFTYLLPFRNVFTPPPMPEGFDDDMPRHIFLMMLDDARAHASHWSRWATRSQAATPIS